MRCTCDRCIVSVHRSQFYNWTNRRKRTNRVRIDRKAPATMVITLKRRPTSKSRRWFVSDYSVRNAVKIRLARRRWVQCTTVRFNGFLFWFLVDNLSIISVASAAKASPVQIPSRPSVTHGRPMRNSVEGLNQEIEKLVLHPGQQHTCRPESNLFSRGTPEGHRAPLADILHGETRSVNTQTPNRDLLSSGKFEFDTLFCLLGNLMWLDEWLTVNVMFWFDEEFVGFLSIFWIFNLILRKLPFKIMTTSSKYCQ